MWSACCKAKEGIATTWEDGAYKRSKRKLQNWSNEQNMRFWKQVTKIIQRREDWEVFKDRNERIVIDVLLLLWNLILFWDLINRHVDKTFMTRLVFTPWLGPTRRPTARWLTSEWLVTFYLEVRIWKSHFHTIVVLNFLEIGFRARWANPTHSWKCTKGPKRAKSCLQSCLPAWHPLSLSFSVIIYTYIKTSRCIL